MIKRQGSGARETFTVRKQSFGVVWSGRWHSPKIEKIDVAARGDVRRAKLYYLRDRVGRGARVRERRWTGETAVVEAGLISPEVVEAGAMLPDDAPRPGEEELAEQAAAQEAEEDQPEASAEAPPRTRRHPSLKVRPSPPTIRRARARPEGFAAARWPAARASRARGSLIELVTIVAVALGLALGIQAFLVKPFRIPSESMVPTLQIGQRVLVDRVSFRFGQPDRGDIVVFKPHIGEHLRHPALERLSLPRAHRRALRHELHQAGRRGPG